MDQVSTRRAVKFYGPEDMANDIASQDAVDLLNAYISGKPLTSMNEALELYNALEYPRLKIYPPSCDDSQRANIESHRSTLNRHLSEYFRLITAEKLEEELRNVSPNFFDDLPLLLARYDVHKRLGKRTILDSLVKASLPLWSLLSNAKFSQIYDRDLAEVVLASPQNATLVISDKLVTHGAPHYSFPKGIRGAEYEKLFLSYIASDAPHMNYVNVLATAKNDPAIGITDVVRLEAKKRETELREELLESGTASVIKQGHGVQIDYEQEKTSTWITHEDSDGTTVVHSISGEYLLSTLNPLDVIENFGDVIGLIDRFGFLRMPAFKSELSPLRAIFVTGKGTYPRDSTFHLCEDLTSIGTRVYCQFLESIGLDIERIIEGFFSEYLREVHGAENFSYSPSASSATFLQKVRHLASEMEGIAKQFLLFCDNGEIDRDLLSMSSGSISWGSIPSLNDDKYLIAASDECDFLVRLLFDTQISLNHLDETINGALVELVQNHRFSYSSLPEFQRRRVAPLIDAGLIKLDEDIVVFSDIARLAVMDILHKREAVPLMHYGSSLSEAAQQLVDRGWLTTRSSLLTPAESSYFNFWLNKSEFSDGPDLRNSYAHGTNPADPATHEADYYSLLKLMIALILKIKNDFEIASYKVDEDT